MAQRFSLVLVATWVLASFWGGGAFAESPQEQERNGSLGVKIGVRAGSGTRIRASQGWSVGLFRRDHGTQVEVLFTREDNDGDDGRRKRRTRYLVETIVTGQLLGRKTGYVRPSFYIGMSAGIEPSRRSNGVFDYSVGLVIGGGVEIGRWSAELRYRHGMFAVRGFIGLGVPALDVQSRSATILLGARF